MSGDYKFAMGQKDINKYLVVTVGSFIQDRLVDKEQRTQRMEQCAERLAAEDESSDKNTEIPYSDQAILANLDWGIDALEEAIRTSNMETKLARLDYAEKMLQVCAMLNSDQKTAGIPNFYLCAWAHLNLSYLCAVRNNIHNAVLHVLEMFIVDPFFSRIDFAPELWIDMFLPHMSSIVGWYSEERHKLIMDGIPDSSDLSFTVDLDQYFNESMIFSMRPDQAEKMQNLEFLYGQSLDENTILYAKYYKDCMSYGSSTNKKVIPMLPIVEPPTTPLHEVSRSIPNYIKFGPILPHSAGFSSVCKRKEIASLSGTFTISQNLEQSVLWDCRKGIPEESENDSDYEDTVFEVAKAATDGQSTKAYNQKHLPSTLSLVDIPDTLLPKISSPTPDVHCQKEHKAFMRLLSTRAMDSTISTQVTALPGSPSLCQDSSNSSDESDGERMELQIGERKNFGDTSTSNRHINTQVIEQNSLNDSDDGSQSCISLPLSEKLTSQPRLPKDFVCPITGLIFSDPVTLETGQTYERKAIQEWMIRGNTTCPITRQPLATTLLPKTNYVLKRLITSWKEQHPQDHSYSDTPRSFLTTPSLNEIPLESAPPCSLNHLSSSGRDFFISHKARRFIPTAVSKSPTSVISQAAVEAIINGLKPYVSSLCTSEDLQECESAVLTIAGKWKDSKADSGILSCLSTTTVVNGFMEVLSASKNRKVLKTVVCILSELILADDSVREILISVDSDFDDLAALLKNGLPEAAVLIYLLRPSFSQLAAQDFVPSIIQLILSKNEESDDLRLAIDTKDAATALLEQILMDGDGNNRSLNAMKIISANGIPALLKCLDRVVDGRLSIIFTLLCCIQAEGSCRNLIANRIDLSPVLALFHSGKDSVRGICIDFLSELVRLSRRTVCYQILKKIKDEGAFSTMHTLLVYLQMAPMEQLPGIATLLLQLDLLGKPWKMSIYREEAVEALVEALRQKEFPNSQITALDALLSLSSRCTATGKSCTKTWLLRIAEFDLSCNALVKTDGQRLCGSHSSEEDEEKASCSWERRVAFVLSNHEKGSIFKALEGCLKSNSIEMAKSSLVVATWLIHMLYKLPDTGKRITARQALLDQFVNILQSSKNVEEKLLATLALRDFITDTGVLDELVVYAKCLYKNLRKLKRNSVVANEILKALLNLPSVNAADLWCCSEGFELDSCMNGEILSLLHIKSWIISGHADGTMKVWDDGKEIPLVIQEVCEHTKAVTSLNVSSSGDKLYSGSLDKTIRVWAIKQEEIHCLQVHDVKEAVHELTANVEVACFTTQGSGVKVYNWSGVPRHVNFNKNVKCLAMTEGKLYCGCTTGCSIQEVDLSSLTSTTFYSGTRKLLGKQTVHSLNIHNGLLFAAGFSVDGTTGKVFSLSSKAVIGSLSTASEIYHVAVNNDFIFTATKCGMIEVWLNESFTRVSTIKMTCRTNPKITSFTTDTHGELLLVGFSDGKIQVIGLA